MHTLRTRPLSRGSRLAASLAVPLLAVTLTACGHDQPTHASGGDATTAAEPTPAGLGAKPGAEVDRADFLAAMKLGAENSTTATIAMTIDASGTEISADGQVDYTTSPPSMAMQMSMPTLGDAPMDLRMLDGTMYINLGELSGGKFFAMDLSDAGGPLGDLSGLTDSFDPLSSFEKLDDAIDTVVFVGPDSVDGDSVDHYRLTVDTSKISEAMGSLAAAGDLSSLPDSLTYDVWLDADHRVRKTTMDLGEVATMEMTASHWGEPVSIEAPPASQTTTMPTP